MGTKALLYHSNTTGNESNLEQRRNGEVAQMAVGRIFRQLFGAHQKNSSFFIVEGSMLQVAVRLIHSLLANYFHPLLVVSNLKSNGCSIE